MQKVELSILKALFCALTEAQLVRYQQDVFLVLPGFKPAAELALLKARAGQIVEAFEPGQRVSIFTTQAQNRAADDYFLGSGDQVRCFLEEEAFDATGQLRQGDVVLMDTLDATPWPSSAHAQPLEVAAGTLVVFHGLLPHYSAPKRSPQSRHAYTLHVTDSQAKYAAHNWLQRDGRLPLRGFV